MLHILESGNEIKICQAGQCSVMEGVELRARKGQ